MARVGLTGGRKGSNGFPQGNPLGGVSIRVTWGGAGLHLPSLSLPLPTAPPPNQLTENPDLGPPALLIDAEVWPRATRQPGVGKVRPSPPQHNSPSPPGGSQ